jgi:hypothetical protein
MTVVAEERGGGNGVSAGKRVLERGQPLLDEVSGGWLGQSERGDAPKSVALTPLPRSAEGPMSAPRVVRGYEPYAELTW